MSEILYLADVIDNDPASAKHHRAAAAELRRQHTQNEAHIYRLREEIMLQENEMYLLRQQRDALLEALKFVVRGVPDTWEGVQKARAAIAKAKGEKE